MRYCMPPDPNPKKPRFVPPAKSCDTHFHIFGPPDKFPFAPTRQYTPPAAPVEHYLNMAAVIGVERGVVVQPSVHGPDNAATLDAIGRSNGRFRGVARIDDRVAKEELARLHQAGIRGVRFNLLDRPRGNVALDVLDRAVERTGALGWSVDLHIDPKNLLAQEKRIRSLPGPIVFDHIARVNPSEGPGQVAFQLLLDLLKEERFWVKLSGIDKVCKLDLYSSRGPTYRDVVPFARAVIAAAPDRVIWGSDWPHSNIFVPGKTPNDGDLMDLLLDFAPEGPARERILVENPARLYDFADG